MPGDEPWEIPPEFLVTPQPLIGFLGLEPESEKQQNHQKAWDGAGQERSQLHPLQP